MVDLAHYGIKRKSGRYPWGSGKDPYQSSGDFLSTVKQLKAKGLTETEIAKGFGMTTTQLRAQKSIAKNEKRKADAAMVARLKEKGMSNTAIGRRMGINESSVRALLDPTLKERAGSTEALAKELKKQVGKDGLVDVGLGVETTLGVSGTKLKTATAMLEAEGYHVHKVKVQQQTTGKFTEMKVLVPPGMDYKTVLAKRGDIKAPGVNIEDRGHTVYGIEKPTSISSKRVKVRYGNEGGADMDGVIEVRRGVKDLTLGGSHYAQVRISVDGTHYLKGMAMYSDDIPKGYDIRFNSNKKSTGNKLDAMKKQTGDPANPFGSVIRKQLHYTDSKGKKKLSAMNIVNDEGTWGDWSKTLSSQFLSKQPVSLAKTQLAKVREKRQKEFEEIMALTNPSVRKKLLQSFADSCDSDAVDLKAAALPRQASQVILPVPKMKKTEVYAPNFKHGERVVLVRHPHGGRFEIPELTVNNRNPHAKRSIGAKVKDAIGIHPKVAEKLSGADFDGDSVLVIPNNSGKVKTAPTLKALKNFDPKASYPSYKGMKPMTDKQKQLKMGEVSNLITDMTIKGANQAEIARAVRHSMVVIDAEKHKLNWKQSEIDNGIGALKKKYQGRSNAGASTLISRAGSTAYLPDRKPRSAAKGGAIDKKTGRKVWEETGATYKKKVVDPKTGAVSYTTAKSIVKSKKLAETHDAFSLVSKDGSTIETVYANHSNSLKAMANKARKATLTIPSVRKNPQAAKTYAPQVKSLKAKINEALRNKPRERQAQVLADAVVRAKRQANPDMDKKALQKARRQALAEARLRTGAGKKPFTLLPSEWRAIQEGAVSQAMLNRVLELADESNIRELATPRQQLKLTGSVVARAKAMSANGRTASEIAEALGISTTSVHRALEEG